MIVPAKLIVAHLLEENIILSDKEVSLLRKMAAYGELYCPKGFPKPTDTVEFDKLLDFVILEAIKLGIPPNDVSPGLAKIANAIQELKKKGKL